MSVLLCFTCYLAKVAGAQDIHDDRMLTQDEPSWHVVLENILPRVPQSLGASTACWHNLCCINSLSDRETDVNFHDE